MTKTFTPNDVLRYLYRETKPAENTELEEAMILQSDLLDQYVQLTDIKEQLDQVRKSPSERTIQAILEYSNSHNPILSQSQ
jgi:lysyl-tRNA synthetase class I